MNPTQKEILLYFAPAWSRRIAVSNAMGPEHLDIREADFEIRSVDASGALSLDAMYVVGMDAPRKPREAVPLFAKLDGGGVAILETRASRTIKRALKEVATGNGLELIYFGAPEALPLRIEKKANRRGAHVAVFRKPLFAGRDSERKSLSIVLPAPAIASPCVQARLRHWRDFLLGAGLSGTAELLLVNDNPADREALQEFIGAELRDLRRDGALQLTTHYRSFGPARALQSAATFARGDYIFWEHLATDDNRPAYRFAIECEDVFACLQAMWQLEERRGGLPPLRACTILPRALRSDSKSGRALALKKADTPPPAALWNRSALATLQASASADTGAKAKAIARRLLRTGKTKALSGVGARCVVRLREITGGETDELSRTPRLAAPDPAGR